MNTNSRPFFQIRHDCLVYYELPIIKYAPNSDNLKIKSYSGKVTTGAQKRIRRSIDLLIQKSPKTHIYNPVTKKNQPFTLNFVTLTVSHLKPIPASEGYTNLMKPFLRKVRKICNNNVSYVWKCELQKRGQIHYHLTTNRFLHLTWIRNNWNNIQRKHRYLDHYATIHKHYDANSTDVHAVYKVRNISAYLVKYLSKNDPSAILDSKVWDCSRDLKRKQFSFTPNASDTEKIQKAINENKVKVISLDQCKILRTGNVKALLSKSTLSQYKKYIT